ncbi:MAG: hypothetical protein ING01_10240, partial [Rhodobacter sp.]|nr:hypothetical protein [Rhodobacter sp.]
MTEVLVRISASPYARSIRCQQEAFGVHFLFWRRSALARTISFRMIAVMAIFAAFPLAISFW